MSRFIVMTATAQMPASVRSPYQRVAVVEVDEAILGPDELPKMISPRARGVIRVVETWERCFVGSSDRCAFRRALVEACAMVERLEGKS